VAAVPGRTYTPEFKAKVVAMAVTTTQQTAANEFGVPVGTLARWVLEERGNSGKTARKIRKNAREVADEARAEVKQYAVDRMKGVTDNLLGVIEKATKQAATVLEKGPGKGESRANWLKSVAAVLDSSVEQYQLLSGKPTGRIHQTGQVTDKHEYHITQTVTADPDLRTRARDLWRDAHRRGASADMGS
jgi:transposase-like protein